MSADILVLPVGRIDRNKPQGDLVLVLRLRPRAARRVQSKAKDCGVTPDELAALLLEKILFPEIDR